MVSIHSRLLIAASLVLAIFLGVGALSLDRAFRGNLESGMKASLLGHVYALLGAADTDHLGRMRLPAILSDPRFSNPDSGLYAQVSGENDEYHWQSPSLVGRSHTMVFEASPGEATFQHEQTG